jgi:hypothetical protein
VNVVGEAVPLEEVVLKEVDVGPAVELDMVVD